MAKQWRVEVCGGLWITESDHRDFNAGKITKINAVYRSASSGKPRGRELTSLYDVGTPIEVEVKADLQPSGARWRSAPHSQGGYQPAL